jgi:nitrogen fixation/metabolism regulation signal transduction histidine kinase
MKLRHKFLLFAVLIHAIFVALSLLLLSHSRYLFIAAEVLILLSVLISVHLYRAFLRPLNLLTAGIESIKDQDFSSKFARTGQIDLDQLIDVYNRMIDQLRTERVKQREQHYFLQRLIDATPTGILILDLDGAIEMLNPAAAKLLGVSATDASSLPPAELPGMLGPELAALPPGQTRIINVSGTQTYRCHKSHFIDRGFRRQFIMIEELTKEIIAAQKKAYDKVIRMMSHEINNSVGAVNSILQSSLDYCQQLSSHDRHDFEKAMQVAINRNISLNRFMSNLADVVRVPPPTRARCDLHELLRAVQLLLSAECDKRRINWVWELQRRPLEVNIDVQQMEQVILNVFKNAVEAIGENGSIIVRTSDAEVAKLSVVDNGKGLESAERPHLFTPFYSTKKDGQGIGLTLIREILINHGFSFNLESGPDGGAEFWIRFS